MTIGWPLWERCGTELEYMVVDSHTLDVRPLVPRLMAELGGEGCEDWSDGPVGWSNELAAHVLEFKMAEPGLIPPTDWSALFADQISKANRILAPWGACLLPGGVHPWMNPAKETVLWEGDSGGIYALYDRLFGCHGHGWSNLQSAHLNLSFQGDEEFGRLHAAIRAILPLLPALAASSPILEGQLQPWLDTRLDAYQKNQIRFPSITGKVIPEAAFTRAEYEKMVFAPIQRDIAPYDPDGLLDHHFLNSRGAIARFDRGAVEIRVLDTQECPAADLAVQCACIGALKLLDSGRFSTPAELRRLSEVELHPVLQEVIRFGGQAIIAHPQLLQCLGLAPTPITAKEIWQHLVSQMGGVQGPAFPIEVRSAMHVVLERGSLSERILLRLGSGWSQLHLRQVYAELAECLAHNRSFAP